MFHMTPERYTEISEIATAVAERHDEILPTWALAEIDDCGRAEMADQEDQNLIRTLIAETGLPVAELREYARLYENYSQEDEGADVNDPFVEAMIPEFYEVDKAFIEWVN
jgi:hypothetical protein